jgi:hypothetical protein
MTVTRTGGSPGLSITLDPVTSPTTSTTQTITGSFTLATADPYTIGVWINYDWYAPTVNHAAGTFTYDVTLSEPDTYYCDNPYGCEWPNDIIVEIEQNSEIETDSSIIVQGPPACIVLLTNDEDLCYGLLYEGWMRGLFYLKIPGAHVSSITLTVESNNGPHVFNVTNYDESTGEWIHYFDLDQDYFYCRASIEIIDTYGNSGFCERHYCVWNKHDPVPLDEDGKKKPKRGTEQNRDKRNRGEARREDK